MRARVLSPPFLLVVVLFLEQEFIDNLIFVVPGSLLPIQLKLGRIIGKLAAVLDRDGLGVIVTRRRRNIPIFLGVVEPAFHFVTLGGRRLRRRRRRRAIVLLGVCCGDTGTSSGCRDNTEPFRILPTLHKLQPVPIPPKNATERAAPLVVEWLAFFILLGRI